MIVIGIFGSLIASFGLLISSSLSLSSYSPLPVRFFSKMRTILHHESCCWTVSSKMLGDVKNTKILKDGSLCHSNHCNWGFPFGSAAELPQNFSFFLTMRIIKKSINEAWIHKGGRGCIPVRRMFKGDIVVPPRVPKPQSNAEKKNLTGFNLSQWWKAIMLARNPKKNMWA